MYIDWFQKFDWTDKDILTFDKHTACINKSVQ